MDVKKRNIDTLIEHSFRLCSNKETPRERAESYFRLSEILSEKLPGIYYGLASDIKRLGLFEGDLNFLDEAIASEDCLLIELFIPDFVEYSNKLINNLYNALVKSKSKKERDLLSDTIIELQKTYTVLKTHSDKIIMLGEEFKDLKSKIKQDYKDKESDPKSAYQLIDYFARLKNIPHSIIKASQEAHRCLSRINDLQKDCVAYRLSPAYLTPPKQNLPWRFKLLDRKYH